MVLLAAVSFFVRALFAECAAPWTAQVLLDCAVGNDPAVRLAAARLAQAGAEVRSTRQAPNPELESKGTWGDGASQVELDLIHTVETGGKRAARTARARAGEEGLSAELKAAQAETALKTVSALYRLRQLQGELLLIDEALVNFSSIGRQLRERPRLAPEQEVSRVIFDLAAADYHLRRAALSGEQLGLLKTLEVSVGVRLSSAALALPPPREDWPEIPEAGPSADPASLQARAALESARAEQEAARAASWPDVRLGPSFQRQSAEGRTQGMIGLTLGLPLPLYHRNAAGRRRALRGEEAAALGLRAVEARARAEREAERARYETAVATLKMTATRRDAHAKHERIEDFFQRGLISSSLVIEAHRQLLDFTRSRNEQELAAVRALWRIRALDGRVLGEPL